MLPSTITKEPNELKIALDSGLSPNGGSPCFFLHFWMLIFRDHPVLFKEFSNIEYGYHNNLTPVPTIKDNTQNKKRYVQ